MGDVPVNDYFETAEVNSTTFGEWLSELFYLETNGALSSENLKSAKAHLAAKAKYGDSEAQVWCARLSAMESTTSI
jgi:hypothetical protein